MIKVMGYSDDSVHIYECEPGKVDNCLDADDDCAQMTSRAILIGTEEAGLVVRVCYAPKCQPPDGPGTNGTWQIAVDLVDDGVPIPWSVRIEADGYTPVLLVDCPKNTPWRWLQRAEEEETA